MIKLIVGQRYQLPHGIGTLMGKECFSADDTQVYLDTENLSGTKSTRYIFDIEECEWTRIMKKDEAPRKYAAWAEQIQELKYEE